MLNEDKNLLISLYSEVFLFIFKGFEVRLYFWFGSDNLFIDMKNDLNLNNEVSFSIINFIGLINLLLFDKQFNVPNLFTFHGANKNL